MTLEQAREWLRHHADNTPMPGAREAYKTILEALDGTQKIVTCSDCIHHHDDGVHFCYALGTDCPDDSEFYCKYGKKRRKHNEC